MSELFLRYLFAMQSWFYDVYASGTIKQLTLFSMSWSISAECWLYLVFPFLFILLFYCKHYIRWTIALGCYFAYVSTLIYLVKKGIYTGNGYPPGQTWVDWFVYLSPYGRLIEFMTGILIGFVLLNTQNNAINSRVSYHGVLALFLIISVIAYFAIIDSSQRISSSIALLRMGPIFLLPVCYLMISLAKGKDVTEKLFSSKILITIGMWSYSIYLWQEYLLHLIASTSGISGPYETVIKSIGIIFILLLASGSYQFIETPARRILLQMNPIKMVFILIERIKNFIRYRHNIKDYI